MKLKTFLEEKENKEDTVFIFDKYNNLLDNDKVKDLLDTQIIKIDTTAPNIFEIRIDYYDINRNSKKISLLELFYQQLCNISPDIRDLSQKNKEKFLLNFIAHISSCRGCPLAAECGSDMDCAKTMRKYLDLTI